MGGQPRSFDDDRLKAAIQRAWSRESAPPDLQRRVAGLLAARNRLEPREPETRQAQRPAEQPSRMSLRPRWYPIAAAILCLLGVGRLSYTLYEEYRPPPPQSVEIARRGKPRSEPPSSSTRGRAPRHDEAVASAATAPSSPVQL